MRIYGEIDDDRSETANRIKEMNSLENGGCRHTNLLFPFKSPRPIKHVFTAEI
jgi:hypothetical protein